MRYQFKRRVRDMIENSDRELLLLIYERIVQMSKQLDTLKADVSANTSVIGSAVALLISLKSELDAAIAAQANGDDGEALAALSSSLEANTLALANAVAANTPASPIVNSSASTPVHPATDLPATPDKGSASTAAEPDPRAPTVVAGNGTDGETPPLA